MRRCNALLLLLICAVGCSTRTYPDPNDPNDVGTLQPEVLRRDLKYASDSLLQRRLSGEITDKQFQTLMASYANKVLSGLRIEKIPPQKAWEYAQVFQTALRWKEAETLYKIAVKAAPNQDRFVNDSLHLAVAMAHNGEVAQAIPVARSTFSTDRPDKAPILTGILLELAPAAQGKGHDVELAELLEDAIPQAEKTLVDASSVPGKAFLMARPHHIEHAWRLAEQLFQDAKRPDLEAAAEKKAQADMAKQASV